MPLPNGALLCMSSNRECKRWEKWMAQRYAAISFMSSSSSSAGSSEEKSVGVRGQRRSVFHEQKLPVFEPSVTRLNDVFDPTEWVTVRNRSRRSSASSWPAYVRISAFRGSRDPRFFFKFKKRSDSVSGSNLEPTTKPSRPHGPRGFGPSMPSSFT
jgi:hypothetical protein